MNSIAEIKGQNGKMILFEDRIVISRKTFGGFLAQGGTGDRQYFLKDIAGLEFKKPSFISNGYLKVLVSGTEDTSAQVGPLGNSMKSVEDPNTLTLRSFSGKSAKKYEQFYHQLLEKYEAHKIHPTDQKSKPVLGKMDELEKLAELHKNGILTDEEFQAEKKKLLNG